MDHFHLGEKTNIPFLMQQNQRENHRVINSSFTHVRDQFGHTQNTGLGLEKWEEKESCQAQQEIDKECECDKEMIC